MLDSAHLGLVPDRDGSFDPGDIQTSFVFSQIKKKKKKGGSAHLSLKLAYVDGLKDTGLEGLYHGTPDSLVVRTRKLELYSSAAAGGATGGSWTQPPCSGYLSVKGD